MGVIPVSEEPSAGTTHYLYCISAECPNCREVTQFVETTDAAVALDMDVPLTGKTHCPECGVHLASIGEEWFVNAEHEIEAVTPTQERDQ